MTIILRAATLADAPALAAFGRKTFFDTFGHLYPTDDADFFVSQRFSEMRTCSDITEAGRYMQLAFDDDQLVGFVDCGPLGMPVEAPAPRGVELYRLYLDISAKGTGLARSLMNLAIDWARTQGAKALYLGVYHDNPRAQAFYHKCGFTIIGAYQFKVGQTLDDERIMELRLN